MNEKKLVEGTTHIVGDVLTPYTNNDGYVIVCHQVNCQGVMGSGLAAQVKHKLPRAYNVYKEKCDAVNNKHDMLGDVQMVACLSDAGFVLANIFGQNTFGRNPDKCYTSYKAVRKALRNIAASYPNVTIRIPYLMGCALGGGNWNEVSAIIQEELVDKGVSVEIWELPQK